MPGKTARLMQVLIAVVVGALVAGGGIATAAALIGSNDVQDNSLRSRDVKDGTLRCKDLTSRLCGLAKAPGQKGDPGAKGDKGDKGDPGAKGDKGDSGETRITSLPSGGFEATNASVSLTPDGVEFGPYANGGAAGGSLCYNGLNGRTLSDVSTLIYRASYSTDDDNTVGVPYLRIFLEGDTHDVIFSPNTQPVPATAEGVVQEWVVNDGTVRYDDDAGNDPDSPWGDVKAAHADEAISSICITTGFSAGTNLAALLRSFDINGERKVFG
jgi:hypothetical protein